MQVNPEIHIDFLPVLLFLFLSAISLAIYFLPTWIALLRHHINSLAIFIVNFLTGWSLIGWVIALVWAVKKKE